ncbi:hypothetical protein OF83DRAFT_1168019 [Amylostereum chailletii]|nr:hypothetical protein OF83DRAFT_1168019 [Amylostereum chailletii]
MAEPLGDEIDTETLQAQLDMSFSFAQDLVSSWMQPSNKLLSNGTGSAGYEKELQDILRRPPRLGVGAPLPDTGSGSSTTREAVRLKLKLNGKGNKRARSKEYLEEKPCGSDDDEDESRTALIRKKVKVDPFARSDGKKKKCKGAHADPRSMNSTGSPTETLKAEDTEPDDGSSSRRATTDHQACKNEDLTTGYKKKKRKKKSKEAGEAAVIHRGGAEELAPSTPLEIKDSSKSTSFEPPPSPAKSVEIDGTIAVPVLNLSGPPSASCLQGGVSDSSTKKKRHRKKKKKKKHNLSEPGGGNV